MRARACKLLYWEGGRWAISNLKGKSTTRNDVFACVQTPTFKVLFALAYFNETKQIVGD
jgi:hypothetical protein